MHTWTIKDLLRAATPYEAWCAPVGPELRLGIALGTGGTLLGAGLLLAAEPALAFLQHPFWLVLPGQAVALAARAAAVRNELGMVYMLWLLAVGLLAWPTRGYTRAALGWQRTLCALALLGTLNGAVLLAGLALLALNAALWLLLLMLAVGCAVACGRHLTRDSARRARRSRDGRAAR